MEVDIRLSTTEIEDALVNRFQNVAIADDEGRKDTKAVRFKPQQICGAQAQVTTSMPEELMSLASEDKAVLHALAKPGMLSNDVASLDCKERLNRLDDWLGKVETPKRGRRGRPSLPPELPSRRIFDEILVKQERPRSVSPEKRGIKGAAPLQRMSSSAEREQFLEDLVHNSKKGMANIYQVELQDVEGLEEKAKQLKLHVRKFADKSTGRGWLVVGTDMTDVDRAFHCVANGSKGGSSLISTLGTLATGAVVCWMYLAFS